MPHRSCFCMNHFATLQKCKTAASLFGGVWIFAPSSFFVTWVVLLQFMFCCKTFNNGHLMSNWITHSLHLWSDFCHKIGHFWPTGAIVRYREGLKMVPNLQPHMRFRMVPKGEYWNHSKDISEKIGQKAWKSAILWLPGGQSGCSLWTQKTNQHRWLLPQMIQVDFGPNQTSGSIVSTQLFLS